MQRAAAARQLQTSADPLAPPAVENVWPGSGQLHAAASAAAAALAPALFVGGDTLLLVPLFALW